VASFGVLYAGHFFLMPPAVRHSYFDFLLPAFTKGYFFWDTTVPNCMTVPYKRDVFLLFTAAGAMALALLRNYPVVGPIISFSLAGLVVYLLQFKGWAYQDIPVLAGGFMLCGAILGAFIALITNRLQYSRNISNVSSVAAYGISVLIAGICLVSASDEATEVRALPSFDMTRLGYSGSAPRSDIDTPFTELILGNTNCRDPIVFMSNAVSPGFPIIMQLRRTPASRHLHECLLSVLQYIRSSCTRDAETQRLLSYEPQVVDQLGQDILKNKPLLVFLQEQPVRDEYLSPYNFVNKYLSRYKVIDSICNFSVYKLNELTPASSVGSTRGPVLPSSVKGASNGP
jgi:hypothetical protein